QHASRPHTLSPFSPRPPPTPALLFSSYGVHPDLHSFPTLRSSDLHGIVMMIRLPDFNMLSDTWGHSLVEEQFFSLTNLLSTFMIDRKSTRLNSSHVSISYAVFCLNKKRLRYNERYERNLVLSCSAE